MRLIQSLFYIGPNRRSQQTAIEWQCELLPADLDAFVSAQSGGFAALRTALARLGLAPAVTEKVLRSAAEVHDPAQALCAL
jgi:hypothetical protein